MTNRHADLQVTYRSITALTPYAGNPRTHSPKQIRKLADSLRTFGWTNPILVDADGNVIAGHGRLEAAKLLGMSEVPTICLAGLSAEEKRAYIIADNRLAELAGWDKDLLALEIQHLIDADIDFDVTDVGFESAEIDLLLNEPTSGDESDIADVDVPAAQGPAITRPGDLWLIGKHRIYCGNALESSSYAALMAGELAQLVFTDPPYNVPIRGHVSGNAKAREFLMASGEMNPNEFTRFLTTAFRQMAAASMDGSIHFVCLDWRHLSEFLRAGTIAYTELKNLCVWDKGSGSMGSLYRSQYELIAVFKRGEAAHVNNVELGRFGRNRTTVWKYAGMNSFQAGREEKLAMHPTLKPVALVADAILDSSVRGAIVLDPFAGAGTTIIAAHRTGRKGYAMELDPLYVDVTLRRLRSVLKTEPVCARTGRSFTSVEAAAQDLVHPAEGDASGAFPTEEDANG